jgi:ABC-type nitrate/sulfonate/bicarbonate transport system permease component
MKTLTNLFRPNHIPASGTYAAMAVTQLVVIVALWLWYPAQLFPSLGEVLRAFVSLVQEQQLVVELWASMMTVFQALAISALVAILISYLTVLPFFRPLAYLAIKMRYNTMTGIIFFIALLMSSGHGVKLSIMVVGTTVYFITGMTQVILSTTEEEMNHARTLGMGEWRSFYEVVVMGKLDQMLEVIRQNFAMIWTFITVVETIYQTEGGIGLLLWKQGRYLHLDAVVAIQLLVIFVGAVQDYGFVLIRKLLFPYADLESAR